MVKEIEAGGLKCVATPFENAEKIAYMIYPEIVPIKNQWISEMSEKYGVPIVVIYIPATGWNDMLTPWAEPGETQDSPPFAGEASKTLKVIQEEVLPEVENKLGFKAIGERDLIGVSLSGLFTLWQWLLCDTFTSIACLSGSFWYPGFIEWFEKQRVPEKSGKAYFLLGVKEPKAWIRAYRSVGVNTERIVESLKEDGVDTVFQWVPGDHFADTLLRAEDALKALFASS